ncbi:nucleoside deaminase [Cellulomonas wangsupingiae]|uniref:Nucleoside deaminase n=1 Tax=Cellulomonas wangsupingiae TaxID=2968085 RepID=A0ABY5K1X0_9CELL|nr:nucleoside deaminase [Cellulomonas wangsupingiae]MCC2335504.1 nucleoside deaminase [Cellulomonas wangsupingiae]MCM0639966.1 nucleoside deaminase [Cellulomonas wangsupingiae]UUI64325.1 nucleoside deaminase [Cellulomonas wangsupingiae]
MSIVVDPVATAGRHAAPADPRTAPDPRTDTDTPADARWLRRAVDLATANVADGGGPFGAVVVAEGVEVAVGQNRVTRDLDPTAHAEVQAIRAACRAAGTFALDGMTLYTSCEPCPMCLAACLWSRVDRVVFSADRHDAGRGGFDDSVFYELLARDRVTWDRTRVTALRLPESTHPFDAWLTHTARTAY